MHLFLCTCSLFVWVVFRSHFCTNRLSLRFFLKIRHWLPTSHSTMMQGRVEILYNAITPPNFLSVWYPNLHKNLRTKLQRLQDKCIDFDRTWIIGPTLGSTNLKLTRAPTDYKRLLSQSSLESVYNSYHFYLITQAATKGCAKLLCKNLCNLCKNLWTSFLLLLLGHNLIKNEFLHRYVLRKFYHFYPILEERLFIRIALSGCICSTQNLVQILQQDKNIAAITI